MKWYSKISIIGIGMYLFYLVTDPTYLTIRDNIIRNRVEESIQPYVESNLSMIIKEQESKLGVLHFGVPKIIYKQPIPGDSSLVGLYKARTDEIYLSSRYLITSERNLTNIIATDIFGLPLIDVKEVLDHELGHFYMDKLNESLGRGDWTNKERRKKVISDGIAEYFRIKSNNGGKNDFKDYGGLPLVKPIIDRHGRRGINYLIANPPSVEDMENLLEYQRRVLATLSNNHKSSQEFCE